MKSLKNQSGGGIPPWKRPVAESAAVGGDAIYTVLAELSLRQVLLG
jgi:hypothetical protein